MPAQTATPTYTVAVSLASAWDDAQAFYNEHDWPDALNWLILVRRKNADFRADEITEMMADTYVGLATNATLQNDLNGAIDYLNQALALHPAERTVAALHDATVTYAKAPAADHDDALKAIQQAYKNYADELAQAKKYCLAVDQIAAANQILADVGLADKQAAYQRACEDAKARDILSKMTGSIIYSAQQGGAYRIFRLPVGLDTSSTLLVENGSQPRLGPDGGMIAFYSTRQDKHGLAGFKLNAGLDPNDRTVIYTGFVEDSRDSPPGWNPQGDRLVYASTNSGDRRSRVYLTWADGSRKTTSLGYGKDPAWAPTADLIVFNGADETGQQPGLWLVHSDGSGRTRLTDNGNDQRPAWSPDGRYVVFMSNGRDGNWELYRVDVADGSVLRLTYNDAQDGLPSVSPDGKYVAFMSDRDGFWSLWYVSIDGGQSRPLARITGQLPKWLEYAIQWVK